MSLLTKASLVMTPNAIKESKVYSIIPSSGNGDLTFTRGTNASGTLNNDNLLIENAPYNLISNSNVFTGAYYNKSLVAVTSNTISSITGAVNASTLTEVAGTNSHHIHENVGSFTPVVGSSYTMSCYLKQPTSSANRYVQLPFFIAGFGSNAYVNFDLQTLTKGTIGASITSSDISLISNGWIRITATAVATATGASGFQLSLIPASTSTRTESYTVTAGSENSIYIYGFQVVFGTVAKDYFNTTDRLNVPRLNYDTVGGCPALLLEPQRTNILTYSEQFDNVSGWNKSNVTVTANSIVSPSGVQNADTIIANGTAGVLHGIQGPIPTALTAVPYSFSCYAKKGTNNFIQFLMPGVAGGMYANFDLNNGVVGSLGATTGATPTSSITNMGNGWFRCNMTFTVLLGGSYSVSIYLVSSATSARAETNALATNVYLWGAQLEQGAYSTSYIPTISGSVTRNADTFTRNNIYTNGLITSDGGTWFVEINNNISLIRDASSAGLTIDSSAGYFLNGFLIRNDFSGVAVRLAIEIRVGGSKVSGYSTLTDTVKIAIKWDGVNANVYVNGVIRLTNIPFTTIIMQNLGGFAQDVPRYIKSMYLFPTPLTDTECISLTT
jgi:hypothetical protein